MYATTTAPLGFLTVTTSRPAPASLSPARRSQVHRRQLLPCGAGAHHAGGVGSIQLPHLSRDDVVLGVRKVGWVGMQRVAVIAIVHAGPCESLNNRALDLRVRMRSDNYSTMAAAGSEPTTRSARFAGEQRAPHSLALRTKAPPAKNSCANSNPS